MIHLAATIVSAIFLFAVGMNILAGICMIIASIVNAMEGSK